MKQISSAAFHPEGEWLVINDQSCPSIYPLHGKHPIVLRGHDEQVWDVRFTMDGKYVLSSGMDGQLRRWALPGIEGEPSRLLLSNARPLFRIALSADGQSAATGSRDGKVFVVSLASGTTQVFEGFQSLVGAVAIDTKARLLAASGGTLDPREALVRLWDLDTGEILQVLAEGKDFGSLAFLPGKRMLLGGGSGLYTWDLTGNTSQQIHDKYVFFRENLDSPVFPVIELSDQDERETYIFDPREDSFRFLAPTRVITNTGGDFYAIQDDEGRWSAGRMRHDPLQLEPASIVCRPSVDTNFFALHPEGTWMAFACKDATVLLAPVPTGAPLQTLPLEEFQAKLESFTNVRAVPDASSETGYSLEMAAFPGWKTLPKR
jgi:WD40 repeat protein